jgi:next-to-BRCA1 protein 1
VCHDTDFCANCEALPTNKHNHTHPLIKFKTPVRNVTVTTLNETKTGLPIDRLGDQPKSNAHVAEAGKQVPEAAKQVPPPPAANTATQVQTIHDVKPAEDTQVKKINGKIDIRNLLAEPLQPLPSPPPAPAIERNSTPILAPKGALECVRSFDALFIRDTIQDGTTIPAGQTFVQIWTLRNPGPVAWPAGCSVRHVGGDYMLNIDNTRPLSQSELAEASESNVVDRAVESGEEISFRVIMKAPSREGTAISYWRLKTAKGFPFGHRLWCHIEVTNPATPPAVPAAAPAPAPHVPAPSEAATAKASSSLGAPLPSCVKLDQPELLHANKSAELQPELQRRMQRVEQFRQACVRRHQEQQRKAHDTLPQAMRQRAAPEVAHTRGQETAELPVEEKAVEAVAGSSGMIFPQLEKESPASSTHEAVSETPEVDEAKADNTTVAASTEQSDEEFFEDAESVEIRSLSSDGDEGFMTDEEYDILNASDEEAA